MGKHIPKTKRVFSNYRVVVEVDEPWTSEKDPEKLHEHWVSSLRSVVVDIKRHVDGYTQVNPDWDESRVCIHCESDPEPDLITGEPRCCNKAVRDYEEHENREEARADANNMSLDPGEFPNKPEVNDAT